MSKTTVLIAAMLLTAMQGLAQADNPKYDQALAASLGGDDYGMKTYVFALLKTGSNTTTTKETVDSLFRGHMQNINNLAAGGKLVVSGPLRKNEKGYRGIFILNVNSLEAANDLLLNDPAIKQKLLEVELFIWAGSAALPEYLKIHEKITKKE